jgi:hypothetical protein
MSGGDAGTGTQRAALWLLLLVAAAPRVLGVTYGLPLALASDEEVLIAGTLRMIETRSLIPSLTPSLAETLYYPTGLPYLYLLLFAPVLGLRWLLLGAPSTPQFALDLAFNTTPYWLAARGVSVAAGVATVWIVYRIALDLRVGRRAAILAGALLAADPIHLMMSATARHWAPTVFLIWLGLWMALRIFRHGRPADYVWGALAGGIGFGVSYIGALALPLVGVAHLRRVAAGASWRSLLNGSALGTVAIAGVLIAFFAATHTPAIARLLGAGAILPIRESKSIAGFLERAWFYLSANFDANPVLVGGGLFAALALLVLGGRDLRRMTVFGCLAVGVAYVAFLYQFMPAEERYALPLAPALCLALAALVIRVRDHAGSLPAAIAAGVVAVYPIATSAQLTRLMLTPDTRIQARTWAEEKLPPGSAVLLFAPGIWLRNDVDTLRAISAADAGALRFRDRQILATDGATGQIVLPRALAHVDLEQYQERHWRANDAPTPAKALNMSWSHALLGRLADWPLPAWYDPLLSGATPVARFEGSPGFASDLDMRRTLMIREPSWTWFRRRSFGPTIEIWELRSG